MLMLTLLPGAGRRQRITFCRKSMLPALVYFFLIVVPSVALADSSGKESGGPIAVRIEEGSITDFHGFVEALGLLVVQNPISLTISSEKDARSLSIVSSSGLGCPLIIHVSVDQVAIGSGPSRQVMTLNDLKTHLEVFAEAAAKTETKGIVQFFSDREVSADFGLSILQVIAESGTTVMLWRPRPTDSTVPIPAKKPSPPSSAHKE
jgi:hypothetical protein